MRRNLTQHLVNHYIKKYPDRLVLIEYKTPNREQLPGTNKNEFDRIIDRTENDKLDAIEKALQKAKTKISDIVLCNPFDMFVTFTFNCRACTPKCKNKPCSCDKNTCKRYDLDYVIRTHKGWYNNQIKKYGRFPYVQVMELHKDKGYHFHALFNNYPGKLKYWRTDKDNRPIYSLASNRKGWTTVKYIYNKAGASSYIKKYITKNMPTFPGKKRFWVSQSLNRPIVVQDPILRQEILNNPQSKIYIPDDKPKLRENGTLNDKKSPLRSIITVELDNQEAYYNELNLQKLSENVRKIFGV